MAIQFLGNKSEIHPKKNSRNTTVWYAYKGGMHIRVWGIIFVPCFLLPGSELTQ